MAAPKGGMNNIPAYKKELVASLIPYASNSRTHSDAQVAQIASSIKEFGFLNPIIVDGKKGVIAGHGRLLAAQKLGLETVPTIEAKHLTEAQRKAYVIADNKLALNADWDFDLLKIELADLESIDFDMALTGFDNEELLKLLGDGLKEDNEITEQSYNEVFEVVVSCISETEQQSVYDAMTKKGYKCRVLSM